MRYCVCALALTAVLLSAGLAQAATYNVSSFSQLVGALGSANPGDVVLIQPGQYHVTSNLYITRGGFTIRGATGNFDDVVLYGNGMNVKSGPSEGIWTAAHGLTIENLTVKDFYSHGVHICDASDGLADNITLNNIKIQNCGERYIKGSGTGTSRNVLIQNVHFLQTEAYLPRPGHSVDPNNYIGGIDAMHTEGWIIRDNRFDGIRGATGGGRGAIFLWNGASNALIERNQIIGCAEGIDLGNGSNPGGIYHADNAIVRNNFIVQYGSNNRPVQLGYTRDIQFYNNTIYTPDNYNRAIHVYDSSAIPTANLLLTNNLIRGTILDSSTGRATLTNNIIGSVPQADWFADPDAGDLHLTALAAEAIDHGLFLANVPDDFDGQSRFFGAAYDIGADEMIPEPATMGLLLVGGVVALVRRKR